MRVLALKIRTFDGKSSRCEREEPRVLKFCRDLLWFCGRCSPSCLHFPGRYLKSCTCYLAPSTSNCFKRTKIGTLPMLKLYYLYTRTLTTFDFTDFIFRPVRNEDSQLFWQAAMPLFCTQLSSARRLCQHRHHSSIAAPCQCHTGW